MSEYFEPAENKDEELFNSLMQGYNMGCFDFTEWEENFVESIESQICEGKSLSEKQIACINRIMAKS